MRRPFPVVQGLWRERLESNRDKLTGDLFEAVDRGASNVVGLLLDRGADVNARADTGDTPLIRAAANGYTDTVRLLIARGADLSARDSEDGTALIAAVCRELACVRLLLDAAPFLLEEKTANGYTALMNAAYCRRTENVQFHLEKGADIHAVTNQGRNALMYAIHLERP